MSERHGQLIIDDAIAVAIRGLPYHLRNFTVDEAGCWNWNGYLTESGYGRTSFNGRMMRTHRAVYSLLKGPLLEGLVLDHLCRNRKCLNPAHLEQVTQAINMERTKAPDGMCKRGHELTPDNIKRVGKSQTCRICWREAKRRSYHRNKAA